MSQSPPIRSAATVVLLQDGVNGPETFLVRRHGQSGFMAGATVFPGGKLDDADVAAQTQGLTPQQCADRLGLADPELAWRIHVAAVRELHEEAHVLLARDAQGHLASGDLVAAIDAELAPVREGHQLPAAKWHELVQKAGLTLALDVLLPFAHWLTPRAEPRRFDTWFFAALQPAGQTAALDPHEASDAFWRTAQQALTEHDAGGAILLPPPTLHTLLRMAALGPGAQDVMAGLAEDGVGPCIEPHFDVASADGPAIILPEDVDHPEHAAWLAVTGQARPRSRFLLTDGRFSFVRR
jgi:8-oxo-dGTP pyrophosphatase MutT (NUDIX family)